MATHNNIHEPTTTNCNGPILKLPNELLHHIAILSSTPEAFLNLKGVNRQFNAIISSKLARDQFINGWIGAHFDGSEKGKMMKFAFDWLRKACDELLRFENEPKYTQEYGEENARINASERSRQCFSLVVEGDLRFGIDVPTEGWYSNIIRREPTAESQHKKLASIFHDPTNELSVTVTHNYYGPDMHGEWTHGILNSGEALGLFGKYYKLRMSRWGTQWFDSLGFDDVMLADALAQRWPTTYRNLTPETDGSGNQEGWVPNSDGSIRTAKNIKILMVIYVEYCGLLGRAILAKDPTPADSKSQ
ncbi:hypothetical protein BJ508DRAFT_332992 [Ascobolus immersus RN42]|uniref:F-box domain-containing protein n=1 Tax=Ascobolus immersus RN42 TaxID=1160509 RepID=A0A3N4HKZ1_ASCIM|nr:hypothetical protein BJ508DRAFT_332992 [Ascobolus immersus RN42]